ncbi:TIGR04282 family arsenosugar biosynthesis glycosyltransferase [uncultured Oceanisphaera sp.]|uniref:TIGR04282 family arsenosugar biosynthesis glycosyltransferase n=1 Tax=uncultured Oceanisphaera sp. TaxID=353858 RepID=UPI00261423D3|nr:TIGR04282 family arsenosugar biosynthesis glycosyltransferase [uncultured Oceanisphaera sp.]
MSTRIIIFAKAPVAELAKTRLIPALGADGAANLARRMLSSTLHAAMSANTGPVELCMTPAPNAIEWRHVPLPAGIELSDQGEGDLGSRMARAARRGLLNNKQVLLIGTDCPHISPALLRQAAKRLTAHDALLHPTMDGGYALLGLRRFHVSLFEHMPWSTDRVAKLTLARIAHLGWRCKLGERLQDIDEPNDLFWLPAAWAAALHSRKEASHDVRV